jgi:hypothetical protein
VVGFVAEDVSHFEVFDCGECFGVLCVGVGFGVGVLFGEFYPDGEFFDVVYDVKVGVNRRFEGGAFFQVCFCFFGVVPEVGVLCFLVFGV